MLASNPILVSQVMAILGNPVSAQRPDLMHFRPSDGGPGGTAPPPAPGGGGGSRGNASLPVLVVSAAALLLLGLAALLVLQWGGRLRRMSRVPQIALQVGALVPATAIGALVIANAGSGGAISVASAARVATLGVPRGSMMSALRSHAVTVPVGTASATWSSLVAIETAISTAHDRLLADEQQVLAIGERLAGTEPSPTPVIETRRPAFPIVLETALQQAVSDHQDAMSSYASGLHSEYDFFVAAARAPVTAAALRAVATHTPPDVQHAVATDLDLVQTQLLQEAQIAEAEELAEASGATVADLSGPAPSFGAPVTGVVTQPFGPTQLALELPLTYNNVFYPHFHTGLDIAAALDTPVHAAAPGRVVLAASSVDCQGNLTGYGNYVVIAHADGFVTVYAHLNTVVVRAGQSVAQGQVIGLLGSTGSSTGPHVHFEIRKSGVYVDPSPYLAAR